MAFPLRLGKILFLYLQAASLHITGFAAQECTVTVNQEPFIEGHLNHNVTISCTYTSNGCMGDANVLWFMINNKGAINICSGVCSNTVSNSRFTLSASTSLRIQQVTHNDSDAMGSDLWLQSTLIIILSLYSICITILLVQTIRSMQKDNSIHNHSSNIPDEKEKSRVCKDLAQEFNRKYRQTQQTALQEVQPDCVHFDDTIYQNA
ncbi:uncharacterized protein LOC144510391 isoform X2 [Mustelus asterias]